MVAGSYPRKRGSIFIWMSVPSLTPDHAAWQTLWLLTLGGFPVNIPQPLPQNQQFIGQGLDPVSKRVGKSLEPSWWTRELEEKENRSWGSPAT